MNMAQHYIVVVCFFFFILEFPDENDYINNYVLDELHGEK